jgi:retron-type reverse transcriptase
MIELVNRITEQIGKGKYTIGIFLDLSKAFDTIDHKILMDKLNYYGIRGITNRWFENYLKQIVKYKRITSIEMVTKTGVPQGSILGPLLFLLYINDIQNCSDIVSSILFADDTSVLHKLMSQNIN